MMLSGSAVTSLPLLGTCPGPAEPAGRRRREAAGAVALSRRGDGGSARVRGDGSLQPASVSPVGEREAAGEREPVCQVLLPGAQSLLRLQLIHFAG